LPLAQHVEDSLQGLGHLGDEQDLAHLDEETRRQVREGIELRHQRRDLAQLPRDRPWSRHR
jgi:hypothetical protein